MRWDARLPTVGAERPVARVSSARVNGPEPVHDHGQHALEVQAPQVRGVPDIVVVAGPRSDQLPPALRHLSK